MSALKKGGIARFFTKLPKYGDSRSTGPSQASSSQNVQRQTHVSQKRLSGIKRSAKDVDQVGSWEGCLERHSVHA